MRAFEYFRTEFLKGFTPEEEAQEDNNNESSEEEEEEDCSNNAAESVGPSATHVLQSFRALLSPPLPN